jgi:hypothetical protein
MDVYGAGFEFISHSIRPAPQADPASFRIKIGGPQSRKCWQRPGLGTQAS